jgi:hypothetical protein
MEFAGTVRYTAPEMVLDDSDYPLVTLATDIYSFGIVGAEVNISIMWTKHFLNSTQILTGQPAFTGCDFNIGNKVLRGDRPQLRNLRGRVADAWPTLDACWVPEPSGRMPMNVVVRHLRQL